MDARVTLREGLIELFACAPQMREHESIVRIEARPVFLWQALGLIGISPGHPVLYDEETGREVPAEGDPVEIDVCYTSSERVRTVPIESWMERSDGKPIGRLPWVFAGSIELEDDSIAADYEGTVVAVVNFGSALVALPELHSDRNEELWLRPATAAIPPIGTRCTLLFRPGPVEISLDATGRLRVGGAQDVFGPGRPHDSGVGWAGGRAPAPRRGRPGVCRIRGASAGGAAGRFCFRVGGR